MRLQHKYFFFAGELSYIVRNTPSFLRLIIVDVFSLGDDISLRYLTKILSNNFEVSFLFIVLGKHRQT